MIALVNRFKNNKKKSMKENNQRHSNIETSRAN